MTTLFGNTAVPSISPVPGETAPKKKHTLLPVLTVLFLISYALMTMLIVEQGQTIESQRALIRELFRDSVELSATKVKEQREHAQAPAAQNPSSQYPSTQAPAKQAPSSQAGAPQTQAAPQKRIQPPSKPAADLNDGRRALVTI